MTVVTIDEQTQEYSLEINQVDTHTYSLEFTFVVGSGGTSLTAKTLGKTINECDEKTEPADTDMLALMDSEDEENPNIAKKYSWENLKNAVKGPILIWESSVPFSTFYADNNIATLTHFVTVELGNADGNSVWEIDFGDGTPYDNLDYIGFFSGSVLQTIQTVDGINDIILLQLPHLLSNIKFINNNRISYLCTDPTNPSVNWYIGKGCYFINKGTTRHPYHQPIENIPALGVNLTIGFTVILDNIEGLDYPISVGGSTAFNLNDTGSLIVVVIGSPQVSGAMLGINPDTFSGVAGSTLEIQYTSDCLGLSIDPAIYVSFTGTLYFTPKSSAELVYFDNTISELEAENVKEAIDELQSTKQNNIGFTPEDVSNKAINFNTLNDTLYPTIQAVQTQLLSLVNGLNWKHSVLYSTTTNENLSLSGLTATIDGVSRTLKTTDRILVKNQTDKKTNGIYNPSATTWTRTTDADNNNTLAAATVYILSGVSEINRVYSVNSVLNLGVNDITFALIAGPGTYTNGSYLSLTGNIFDVDVTALRVNLDQVYALTGHTHALLHDYTTQFNQATAAEISGLTAKTAPVDNDVILIEDSETTPTVFGKKKLSWSYVKSVLKTYFDGIYSLTTHTHTNVWTPITFTYASATSFTFTAPSAGEATILANSISGRLLKWLSTADVAKFGFITSATANGTTVTVNFNGTAMVNTDKTLYMSTAGHKIQILRANIPGEVLADSALDIGGTWRNAFKLIPVSVDTYVDTAPTGGSPDFTYNIYDDAVAIFTNPIPVGVNTSLLNQVPTASQTILVGSKISIRCVTSVGTTNKATGINILIHVFDFDLYNAI
jgi:hypothetical protein